MSGLVRSLALAGAAAAFGVAAAACALAWMISMPGESYRGALPPPGDAERDLAQRLRRHVAALAGAERNLYTPHALEAAARHIEAELAALGLGVDRHVFDTWAGTTRNLVVQLDGATEEVLVVGAHYDTHRGSPGANDNASGVAAALELARLLRGAGLHRSVRFVWFANEESPFFGTDDMGSRRYVRHVKARGDRIVGMLSLETIGYYSDLPGSQRYPFPLKHFYPNVGDFVAFVGNLASRRFLRDVIGSFRRHARIASEGAAVPASVEGVDWSDHASFWAAGYPALMITDTAPFRYPHYHLPSDTPERLDYERLARVVAGLDAMLRELAGPRR